MDDQLDFPGAVSSITDYCSRNRIPPKTALRIQQVFEELVRQILLPDPDISHIRFTAEYSETEENAVITVLHDGETSDSETPENRLSAAIIQNAITAIECCTVPDAVPDKQIILQLKKD